MPKIPLVSYYGHCLSSNNLLLQAVSSTPGHLINTHVQNSHWGLGGLLSFSKNIAPVEYERVRTGYIRFPTAIFL